MKKLLKYLLIGIAVIAGTAVVLNFVMFLFVGGRQVTVPDIMGLREAAARKVLEESGLRYEHRLDIYSIEYPESTIAEQDPPPGVVVKQGRKVRVSLSMGGEFQDVPYCLGKSERAASLILERVGLEVGSVSRTALGRTFPGEVMASEPLPGVPVVKGSRVNLLVSTGGPAVRVLLPDLRFKPSVSVKLKLEQLGLYVKQSSLDEDLNPLRSYIVLHKPPRGSVVERGDTVTLFVSSELDRESR